MPRFWPGFLAVWAAIILHLVWVGALLWPGSHAGSATPVHEVVSLTGTQWRAALLFLFVAAAALVGTQRRGVSPAEKIFYLLPQQLVLGISAAGAFIAMHGSHFADGVGRPATFIVADQLAVVLTWASHTAALMFLYLIHRGIVTFGGRGSGSDDS